MMKNYRVIVDGKTEGPHGVWEGQGRLASGHIWYCQVKLGSKERKTILGRGNSVCKDTDVGQNEKQYDVWILTLNQELLFSQWPYDIGVMI